MLVLSVGCEVKTYVAGVWAETATRRAGDDTRGANSWSHERVNETLKYTCQKRWANTHYLLRRREAQYEIYTTKWDKIITVAKIAQRWQKDTMDMDSSRVRNICRLQGLAWHYVESVEIKRTISRKWNFECHSGDVDIVILVTCTVAWTMLSKE